MNEKRAFSTFIAALFTLLILYFMYSVAEVLLLFFIAILFGVYLAWITDVLQRRLGVPRWAGMLGALLITGVAVTGIGFLIVPPLISQTQELLRSLPGTLAGVEARLIEMGRRSAVAREILGSLNPGQSYTGTFLKGVTGSAKSMVPLAFHGAGFVIHFISVLVMGIYLALKPS